MIKDREPNEVDIEIKVKSSRGDGAAFLVESQFAEKQINRTTECQLFWIRDFEDCHIGEKSTSQLFSIYP
jgi:hypothetical protein